LSSEKEISVCEEAVFSKVYNDNIEAVRNFVYYKNGDLDKAEDIAQESFVKTWQKCAEVSFEKVRGFLFTVANRLFLNDIRSNKVRLKCESDAPKNVNTESPEHIAIGNEFKEKLEGAISDLPEKQRVVFLMNRIDKMTFAEIAEQLDISKKAVEKRMGIALKTLKEKVIELKTHKI